MMNLGVQIFAIAGALLALGAVFVMLRRKSFRERHAVWYLLAALGAVFVAVFPGVMAWAAGLIGVAEPLNLVFFVSILLLFLIAVQFSTEITSTEARIRRLAEESALREVRLRELDREVDALRARVDDMSKDTDDRRDVGA